LQAGQSQPPEESYSLVRAAIRGRRPIAAVYEGCKRLLCAHKLGWNKDGQLRVLCYQYAGESQSGLGPAGAPENWRCLAIEKLSDVELLETPWQTATNHSRPQTCIEDIDIDVEDYPERQEPQNGH
jgi:hypothetical protein